MKLVELLAKELSEWPNGCDWAVSVNVENVFRATFGKGNIPKPDPYDKSGHTWSIMESESPIQWALISRDLSVEPSDRLESIVSRDQWQAERDRQKGGEWKRARGSKPKYETETPQRMEVRHRDGDITKGWTSQSWNWSHNDGCPSADIMAWRIISQPQAEEVEVKDTTIGTLSYKVEIDTTEASQAIDGLAAKWDQIETPFKWRDEVTELNAYIEKYTRERDALIERLSSEGFALIPPVVSVMSVFSGVDMTDWRNWKDGDKIRMTADDWCDLSKGEVYEIIDKGRNYITILDDVDYRRKLDIDGDTMFEDGRLLDFEFVSRP